MLVFAPVAGRVSCVVSRSIACLRFAAEVSAYASDLRLLGSWSMQRTCIEMNLYTFNTLPSMKATTAP